MNMREKIARGIKPSAFDENWQELYFFKAWQDEARAKAFSQADAALDALMDATPEMIRALKPDMDYEEAFQAMIRAAKEGK